MHIYYEKLLVAPIPRWNCWDGKQFSFLNLEHEYAGWDFTDNGMLWAYNQNYFDWINQEGFSKEDGCKWIDRFISDVCKTEEVRGKMVGLDPYPIALRSINWVKFFCRYPDCATKPRLDSLYSQLRLLEKKLEYHLLGNHLLEDAYALYIGAAYFQDERLLKKATKLLIGQLKEQILPDGAHYEQSPMYHCILLDRLLDAISISQKEEGRRKREEGRGKKEEVRWKREEVRGKREEVRGQREEGRGKKSEVRCKREEGRGKKLEVRGKKEEVRSLMSEVGGVLCGFAVRMLGHLESVIWDDGSIPILNDSAVGIAPTPYQIFDYARRLGLEWKAIPMNECGYRKLKNERMEAIVDIGNITATYQPGHTHADTFNYELRIDGKPFIVDTGTSTYEKNDRRQIERSTKSHNCVVVDGKNSSEVYGGFRVGQRAIVNMRYDNGNEISASHNGYKKKCERLFKFTNESFVIEDSFEGKAINYIHLSPDLKIINITGDSVLTELARIDIKDATAIAVEDCLVAREYNKLLPSKQISIKFKGHCKVCITPLGEINKK